MFIQTYHNLSIPIQTFPNLSQLFQTYHNLSKPIPNYPKLSQPIRTYPNLSKPILNYPNLTEHIQTSLNLSKTFLSIWTNTTYPNLSEPIRTHPKSKSIWTFLNHIQTNPVWACNSIIKCPLSWRLGWWILALYCMQCSPLDSFCGAVRKSVNFSSF